MMAVLTWIAFLPVFFLSSIAAWAVSPLAPFFAHDFSLKGTWLWWCTTPNTDLRGDPDHQKRWEGRSVYLQQVTWILRNPSVNFQREVLGVHVAPTDEHIQLMHEHVRRDFIRRDGKTTAWMIFGLVPYPGTKHGFRILIGWKCWDAHVKDPLQMTCRITPWKTME